VAVLPEFRLPNAYKYLFVPVSQVTVRVSMRVVLAESEYISHVNVVPFLLNVKYVNGILTDTGHIYSSLLLLL